MIKAHWSIIGIIGLIALLLLFSAGMFSGWNMMGTGLALALAGRARQCRHEPLRLLSLRMDREDFDMADPHPDSC